MTRDLARLADDRFDLLVVGGGIYGAWSAYDAALRGLRVAIVERSDWASEASSSSSKLVHGGLRYLEHLRLLLVRKSLAERGLLARLGPHRVAPLRFVFPVRRGDRLGRLRLSAGLSIYDALARDARPAARHAVLDAARALDLCPYLSADGLLGGFEYGDCVTDDARFTLEIVSGAAAAGAATASRAEATRLLRAQGRVAGALVRDVLTGEEIEVRAAVVLDAAGARAGRLSGAASSPAPLVRRSKGVHLVLPPLPGDRAVVVVSRTDGRPIFLIPWYGRTLVGTTDSDFRGEPAEAAAEEGEILHLLREANRALGACGWDRRDVISSFAGLRALRNDPRRPSADVTREWFLERPEKGLLVSVGGKYTSARADAARALDRVMEILGKPRSDHPTATRSFPWCPDEPVDSWLAGAARAGRDLGLDDETAAGAARRYGTTLGTLHRIVRENPSRAARVDPGAAFCAAEIVHAARSEGAIGLEDVVRRRIPLVLVCRAEGPWLDSAARILGAELGWSAERARDEAAAVRATCGPRTGSAP